MWGSGAYCVVVWGRAVRGCFVGRGNCVVGWGGRGEQYGFLLRSVPKLWLEVYSLLNFRFVAVGDMIKATAPFPQSASITQVNTTLNLSNFVFVFASNPSGEQPLVLQSGQSVFVIQSVNHSLSQGVSQ